MGKEAATQPHKLQPDELLRLEALRAELDQGQFAADDVDHRTELVRTFAEHPPRNLGGLLEAVAQACEVLGLARTAKALWGAVDRLMVEYPLSAPPAPEESQ